MVCPQLCLQAVYEKDGNIYAWGWIAYASNSNNVRQSEAVALPAGAYNVTALGYANSLPPGYEVSYRRNFDTAVVS